MYMTEGNSTLDQKFFKVWLVLLGVAFALFMFMAIFKLFVDADTLVGAEYLITGLVMGASFFLVLKDKLNARAAVGSTLFFMGYIFSVVGLAFSPFFWGLGILVFASSLIVAYRNRI
jgi:hypothetical protein